LVITVEIKKKNFNLTEGTYREFCCRTQIHYFKTTLIRMRLRKARRKYHVL